MNVVKFFVWAYCVFDDIIEHCGKESLRYADTFLTPLINDLCHPIGELRQATAYGVGVLAKASAENKLFGSAYDAALNTASQNLKKSIDEGIKLRKQDDIANKDNDEDFVGDFEVDPWENSVSAFGKILRYRSDILAMEDWFSCWINWLDEAGGISSDNEEAVATMEWLNGNSLSLEFYYLFLFRISFCVIRFSFAISDCPNLSGFALVLSFIQLKTSSAVATTPCFFLFSSDISV